MRMKSSRAYAVALVTAPDVPAARQLAESALQARLAACVNLIPKIESHYWWQGKLETSAEMLMLFKTPKAKLPALEQHILKNHPYDTPEFVVLPLSAGNQRYLDWLGNSVKS